MGNVMNRTVVAATLLIGTLLTAPVDGAAFAAQGSSRESFYDVSSAHSSGRRAQIDADIISQETPRRPRGQHRRHTAQAIIRSDSRSLCTGEVLRSEELMGAPIFYHFVRATFLITPPSTPAFETTLEKLVSWQVPPPRQGQRFKLPCHPVDLRPLAFH